MFNFHIIYLVMFTYLLIVLAFGCVLYTFDILKAHENSDENSIEVV